MLNKKKVLLLILDGLGLSDKTEGNAFRLANPEFLNKLFKERPLSRLAASGPAIGLPAGQMGNSEVGHLVIGAGRAVQQDISRINRAIEDGTFQENVVLKEFLAQTKQRGKALHLLGLVSTGGIHSHQQHLSACLQAARQAGLERVYVHVITDGKDTSPTSGVGFVQELQTFLQKLGVGRIATISGRHYAMDRDGRWERTEKAYLAMVHGVGNRVSEPVLAMEASYKANVTDEFVVPVVIEEQNAPVATLADEDSVLSFNFRADRMRQITGALLDEAFSGFARKKLKAHFLSLTPYEGRSEPVPFPDVPLTGVLGEVVAQAGICQLRLAESEKTVYVTQFLNGGPVEPFPLEERLQVPSPKVKSYDQKPEMAAFEVGDALMERIQTQKYGFIVANFANGDMVGHTGNLQAAIKAVSTVDCVLSKVIPLAYDLGYDCLITSDHGNVEQMIDDKTGEPFPEHTLNPVPFCVLSREFRDLRPDGGLGDIAPTILDMLGLEKPPAMDGASLIIRKK